MKTSNSLSQVPSLFQIAAFFDDFFPTRGIVRSVPNVPIAGFMNPDKLMTLLGGGKNETCSVTAPPDGGTTPAKRPNTNSRAGGQSKKPAGSGNGNGNPSEPTPESVKKVEFKVKSPAAKSVKLAGDFTEWEKRAVDLIRSNDGLWSAVVPLKPGEYSYRFIVDGRWTDDPGSSWRTPNPFGGQNALIRVT